MEECLLVRNQSIQKVPLIAQYLYGLTAQTEIDHQFQRKQEHLCGARDVDACIPGKSHKGFVLRTYMNGLTITQMNLRWTLYKYILE